VTVIRVAEENPLVAHDYTERRVLALGLASKMYDELPEAERNRVIDEGMKVLTEYRWVIFRLFLFECLIDLAPSSQSCKPTSLSGYYSFASVHSD
jgi:hypothetical protein